MLSGLHALRINRRCGQREQRAEGRQLGDCRLLHAERTFKSNFGFLKGTNNEKLHYLLELHPVQRTAHKGILSKQPRLRLPPLVKPLKDRGAKHRVGALGKERRV